MPAKLLSPEAARGWLARRYERQHRSWLFGQGDFPLSLGLGEPGERDALDDPTQVRAWVTAWTAWREHSTHGQLVWEERRWPRLGPQRLPVRLVLSTPQEVAELAGQGEAYRRASQRYSRLVEAWSALAAAPSLSRHLDTLAHYCEADFERLLSLLRWLQAQRDSGLSLRQLPVPGIHTKWIDAKRRGLICDLLSCMRGADAGSDFYALCGLRPPAHRVRVRVLCPGLRRQVGGLGDIEAPLYELARMQLDPERVLIVENLETGITLPDYAGCVALIGLGMGVSVAAELSFVRDRPTWYWGDIDTHGLVMLERARAVLPDTRSILMDTTTLLDNRSLWSREDAPHRAAELPHLTAEERELFAQLRANTWGEGVRLEQERVPWSSALQALDQALHGTAPGDRPA